MKTLTRLSKKLSQIARHFHGIHPPHHFHITTGDLIFLAIMALMLLITVAVSRLPWKIITVLAVFGTLAFLYHENSAGLIKMLGSAAVLTFCTFIAVVARIRRPSRSRGSSGTRRHRGRKRGRF